MTASLTEIRAQNILNMLTKIKTGRSVRYLTLLRLAGMLAAATPEPIDSQTCVDTIRQCVGCIQHKSSGWYKVTKTPSGCVRTLGLGRHPSVFSESYTYTRAHEHVSGRVVTKCASGRGMATPSRDRAINLEHVRGSRRGSVRKDSVSAMSEMVLAKQGSGIARAGCDGPQLAEWSPQLVLSRIRVMSQPLLLIAPAGQTSRGFGSFTIF